MSELSFQGPTMRDYFAAAVLNGLVTCTSLDSATRNPAWFAATAYEFADAMMKQRAVQTAL